MVICPLLSKNSMSFDRDYYSLPSPTRDKWVRWHAGTNCGHLPPLPTRDKWVPWHAETNYGPPLPFPSRDNRVRWHAETNYGHLSLFVEDFNVFRPKLLESPLCQPETSESVGIRRQIMVIRHLCYLETIESDSMQRQIMVIRHPYQPETSKYVGMQRQIMVTRFRCHPETIESDGTQRQIMVICSLLSKTLMSFDRDYYSLPFVNQRQVSSLACRDKLWYWH